MSQITTLSDRCIAYAPPKDAHSFRVDGTFICMQFPGEVHELNEYYDEQQLPEGDWQILGRGHEITEEQWKEVVEYFSDYEIYSNSGYRHYSHPQAEQTVKTATESGLSLLKSKSLSPESVIILYNNKQ